MFLKSHASRQRANGGPSSDNGSTGSDSRPSKIMKVGDAEKAESSEMGQMDWAMLRNDLKTAKEIFDRSEKSCIRHGVNCPIVSDLLDPNGLVLKFATHPLSRSRWTLLTEMLKIDPLNCKNAKTSDGSTLLMTFSNNVEQIKFLLNEGWSISDLNDKGQSVFLRSFLHPDATVEAFSTLLGLMQSDEDAQKLFSDMLDAFVTERCLKSPHEMLQCLLTTKPISLNAFETHPLLTVIENLSLDDKICKDRLLFLQVLAEFSLPPNGVLNPHIVVQRETLGPEESGPRCLRTSILKDMVRAELGIPRIADFDLAGLFLLKLKSNNIRTWQDYKPMKKLLQDILELLLTHCHYNCPLTVTDPLIALSYNILDTMVNHPSEWYDCNGSFWSLRDRNEGKNPLLPIPLAVFAFDFQCIIEASASSLGRNECPEMNRLLKIFAHIAVVLSSTKLYDVLPFVLKFMENSSIHPYHFLLHCKQALAFFGPEFKIEYKLEMFYRRFVPSYVVLLHYLMYYKKFTHITLPVGSLGGLPRREELLSILEHKHVNPHSYKNVQRFEALKPTVSSLEDLSIWALRGVIINRANSQGYSAKKYVEELVKKHYLPKNAAASLCICQSSWPCQNSPMREVMYATAYMLHGEHDFEQRLPRRPRWPR